MVIGTSITIVGNNFESGCNVHFISSVNGSSMFAGSVAFVNSGILTATAPALTVSGKFIWCELQIQMVDRD